MRSGAIIYPLLANYANLTSIIPASKIFAVRAEQPTTSGYIVYGEVSSVPTNTKGDSSSITADPRITQRSLLDITTVQISIFADNYLTVENAAVAVRQALDREWGAVSSPYTNDISLDSCVYDSCVDDYDDDFGDSGIFIKHLDFTLRINRLDISN